MTHAFSINGSQSAAGEEEMGGRALPDPRIRASKRPVWREEGTGGEPGGSTTISLLIATSNPGKTEELRLLLESLGVTLRTLAEFPEIPDVPEGAPTFEENAIMKAQYYCERTGLPTIADDGGLEIDALDGWPGVHSRRIFGDGRRATDEEMIAEVLLRMDGIPQERRGCQMRSVVAFVGWDGTVLTGSGIDRGIIAAQPSAHRIHGFPFRSLFYHPEQRMTTAEAVERGAHMEDVMTHRRDAVRTLLPRIEEWRYTMSV